MNPLLDFSALSRFQDLKPEHVTPALEELLAQGRATTAAVIDASASWDAFVAPLEDANERVARAWGQVSHLHAVLDSPALRAAYNANLPKISQYWTELGQNPLLFEKYRALRESAEFVQLSEARRKIVDNALRDFRLGGAELPPQEKARFAAIQEELARLGAKFSENLLDATNAFSIVADEKEIAGIPDDVLHAAREALRLLGPGAEALLSGGCRHRRAVQGGRNALRHHDRPRQGCGVARGCALLRDPRQRRRAPRAVLRRSLCPRHQARRRLDGRCHHAPAQGRAAANPRRLPELQFFQAGRRQTRAIHPRRGADALPRVRARPASPAHARRRSRRLGPERRRMGRGGAAEPVHGELLLGMGGAAPHDAPRRHRRAAAARALRQDDRGEELPQRPGDAAPD